MTDKIEVTSELLTDLKEKAEKATPGSWVYFGYESGNGNISLTVGTDKPGHDICKTSSQLGHHNCSCNAIFITAAKPAVVLALIEKIERLEEDFEAADRSAAEESVKVVKLDMEADWLAEKLADISGHMFDDELEELGFQCSQECEQSGCTLECRKRNWKESARKAMSETDNA